MKKLITLAVAAIMLAGCGKKTEMIEKNDIKLESELMTPEALWAMGRIGSYAASPDGKKIAYQVTYYSVEKNSNHTMLYVMSSDGKGKKQLTKTEANESDPAWINDGKRIAFISGGEIWSMKPNGKDRKQMTNTDGAVEGFKFSPDGKKVVYVKSLPYYGSIKKNPDDLPEATGRLVVDMNYRHWDHYVETIPHPFVANVDGNEVGEGTDILGNEPYECPTAPFGGMEELAWSPDSKQIAYTCRKKEGVQYAISTDTDIYLYDIESMKTRNLCKPEGYVEPEINATKTMKNQAVNKQDGDLNVGYDKVPRFSPDGKYVAWMSMKRNGYESDRTRLCLYELANGNKTYVTEQFESGVDDYCWAPDSRTLYFIGVWHGQENMYRTDIEGNVTQLTDDWADFGSLQMLTDKKLLAERHSFSAPADLFVVTPTKHEVKAKEGETLKKVKSDVEQITDENKHILDQLKMGECRQQWCKTSDGKQMMYWIILPPNFDENKKYPTLLFCEGGPQSPVSQFWSYRWNFQIMAANGYVIIAPNRRGLPGFGMEWLEQISGDWTGQCIQDYLTAIDDACATLPYVDKDKLGAVGASFGGFSVYTLCGNHNKRFKCFIAHDGAFNLESMYTDTEEVWFSNWEYEDAYWNKDQTANARKTYANSPHLNVDKWDTPILCIHGEKDYRINANQGMGAFNAARLRGIPAQLLIYPDENHWVLKPQNGVLWQRTFFNWLDQWLKV